MNEDTDLCKAEESVEATADWREYRAGKGDKAGRKITRIYAADKDYVIYFLGCDLYYETTPEIEHDLGSADASLARINRLLDSKPSKNSREYNENCSILELTADALEMFFCGEKPEAIEILNGLCDKLKSKEEGQRRLFYQLGTFVITMLVWSVYLAWQTKGWFTPNWEPWFLAAALAMAGGLFSVCLSIGSLEVNVNQEKFFLLSAGATRAIVALLAGAGLLLAMRSKIFGGITYDKEPPNLGDALKTAEVFFCFLAGFSETFVPNILSKATETKDKEKAAVDKGAANRAAADEKTAPQKSPHLKTSGAKPSGRSRGKNGAAVRTGAGARNVVGRRGTHQSARG
ncbi:MAG: hypothetical protein QOE26_2543 [Verrucomicrobiota bacterium]|jgi:hypothetical protein